ncbi:MAG: DNA-binding protein [Leptolyngbya sp. SIO4C1]|nr:DNA-binding protein [Leptolyngbya sp. SIO4C1]
MPEKPEQQSEWVGTPQLAKALGVSQKFLRNNREKFFIAGTHYRNINPTAWRPTYRWHRQRCEARLDELDLKHGTAS